MKTIQPEGPYFLGGYSIGGLIAFEMAQQLHRQGEETALLFLLDPTSPSKFFSPEVAEGISLNSKERTRHSSGKIFTRILRAIQIKKILEAGFSGFNAISNSMP